MSRELIYRKRSRLLSWSVNLSGILAFALILHWGGAQVWRQIVQADLRYLLAALITTLLWNMVAAYRWSRIADEVADHQRVCSYRYYLTYHMIGMLTGGLMSITVGMLGGRTVALSLSRGLSIKLSALSTFLDKVFDLILALVIAVPAALYLMGWMELPLALVLIGGTVVASFVVLLWQYGQAVRLARRCFNFLARLLARVPLVGKRVSAGLPGELDGDSESISLSHRTALQAFLLTVIMYSLLSTRLILIALALRLEIPWYLLAMGVSITQLSVLFAITPGSLGFLEGGWWAVLTFGGLKLDQFTAFVVGRRAFALAFTIIGVALAFAWIRESPARLFRAMIQRSRGSTVGNADTDGP